MAPQLRQNSRNVHSSKEDYWKVCTGAVDQIIGADVNVEDTGLEKPVQHEFVADTLDGGIAICLPIMTEDPCPSLRVAPIIHQ